MSHLRQSEHLTSCDKRRSASGCISPANPVPFMPASKTTPTLGNILYCSSLPFFQVFFPVQGSLTVDTAVSVLLDPQAMLTLLHS